MTDYSKIIYDWELMSYNIERHRLIDELHYNLKLQRENEMLNYQGMSFINWLKDFNNIQ